MSTTDSAFDGATKLNLGNRPRSRAWIGAGFVLAVLAIAMIADAAHRHAAAAHAPGGMPMPKVTVSAPLAREIDQRLGLLGQFAPANMVELRAQVGGTLVGIHFTDGAIVHKGDLLFTIDPAPYEIKLAQANATLETANARLALTERELARAVDLKREEAGSIENVDQRTADQRNAVAAVHAAQAQVADAKFDLDHCRITAPFTGRIGTHQVSLGNLIAGSRGSGNPTTLLATLVSIDPIYFNFDMSESDYQRFERSRAQSRAPGAEPVLLALGNETEYRLAGTLDFVDNQLDRSSGVLHARATVPNAGQLLTPGEFARVRIAMGEKKTQLLVPDSSVLPDQSQQVVLTVGVDGTVVPKPVTIGDLRGGLRVITGGLTPTDRVITEGIPYATPGSKVETSDGPIDAVLIRDVD